mgnify:CR=1 FL=1
MRFERAYVPVGFAWSSPFARWQGVLSEVNSLDLAVDNESLKSSLSAFVTAYNSTINLLKSSSAYNSTTQTASALTGESRAFGVGAVPARKGSPSCSDPRSSR